MTKQKQWQKILLEHFGLQISHEKAANEMYHAKPDKTIDEETIQRMGRDVINNSKPNVHNETR